jgi:hypothetical protein
MRFTPVIIVYIIVLLIAAIAVKELNKCTMELREYKNQTKESK